ncbi:type II toxin-antitoxin system VapC family toxin [Corynebacterium sp. HMSC036E10]|uniref:type II toxin-antitoxin system VapC family toxin n=1 Tax=Corynebacterium sp. HMSC036E10 TaxID=1715215 RepID=UPI0009F54A56|nr:type II toxin-antitoxin system VapC family toxin [Corynebacterium sp. HMSC036E10]
MYLLDTNAWIDLERGKQEEVNQRFLTVLPSSVRVSTVVLGELYLGAARSRDAELACRVVENLVGGFDQCGVSECVAHRYADLTADLAERGQLIGVNDRWIAAQALANDLVLVTANTGEFSRVKGLRLENWRLT